MPRLAGWNGQRLWRCVVHSRLKARRREAYVCRVKLLVAVAV